MRLFSLYPFALPGLMLLAAGAPLGLALLSQYGFGLHPCELCIWQRYPYAVLIGVAVLALCLYKKAKAVRLLLTISVALWLLEAALAFYHVGVEQRWWASATGCSAAGQAGASLDTLRAQILGAPLVACDTPELVVLGLSMAGWNVVYSLACALAGAMVLIKWRA